MTSGRMFPQSARCQVRLWIRVVASVFGSFWNNFTPFYMKEDWILRSILVLLAGVFNAPDNLGNGKSAHEQTTTG